MKKCIVFFAVSICAIASSAYTCNAGDCIRRSDVIEFSRKTRCPDLNNNMADNVALLVSSKTISSFRAFQEAYKATCDYYTSVKVSLYEGQARILVDIINFSEASGCPRLNNIQALEVASTVRKRLVNLRVFKFNYERSCNYDRSLFEAARPEAHR